ncbi:MJ0042-type zinc finger domain-containing protein [Asticcacaulis sp.]|uniref:MJ0042-type zinc finger domain-containing protein n=1 Tax=Asticcacaulis sp. TaxID=1872648 RepID=UPI0031D1E8F0
MLLTCPKCALSYAIDEAQLGPQGRTVRCASCKTTWHAEKPEEPIELPIEKAVEKPATGLKEVKAKKIPSLYRDMIESQKRHKALMAQGVIWGALAATFIVMLGTAFLLRVDLVRAFPRLGGAYAAVGIPVNAAGLDVLDSKLENTLRGGRFVATVTLKVKNIRDEANPVPPVRVDLMDKDSHPLDTTLIPPLGLTLEANETRILTFDIPDPANRVKNIKLAFDMQAAKDLARVRPSLMNGTGGGHGEAAHGAEGHDAAAPAPEGGHDAAAPAEAGRDDAAPAAENAHGDATTATDHATEKPAELRPAHGAPSADAHH